MAPEDPLRPYRGRRDFSRTREPAGSEGYQPAGATVGSGRFVVHRHEATRLHYDLRLEIEGVLRSWAVPKGFRFDPADKVLAVRTEDHPVDYLDFEGTIPLGEYGGGTMQIWDRGIWTPAAGQDVGTVAEASRAGARGELKIVLSGRRLRGEWHLVQTARGAGKADWLLFKAKDRYAADRTRGIPGVDVDLGAAAAEVVGGSADLGRLAVPIPVEVPDPADAGLDAPDVGWENDFEGTRARLGRVGDRPLWSGADPATLGGDACPDERAALEAEALRLRGDPVVLDGVVVRQGGASGASRAGSCCFYAFDVLHYEGLSVRGMPLRERKELLRRILPPRSPRLLFVDPVVGRGAALLEAVARAGMRGIVGKPLGAPFEPAAAAGWSKVTAVWAGHHGSDAHAASPRSGAARAPGVRFTNLDKVLWPEAGVTKREMIAYYERVAPVLLPYLVDRPLHMQRFPDGIHGEAFYQRRPPDDPPAWMRVETLLSSGSGEPQRLVVCDDERTLLQLANLAAFELHPWMSRVGSPDTPDYLVLDLDPKQAPFAHVVRIARSLGRLLRGIGLRPALKTSGRTGLHVQVAVVPEYGYEQTRWFAEGVARAVVRELPDLATVERDPAERGGRVYVDFGQNGRGRTVVPPYVLRPTVGATVSAPLDWDELDAALSPALFDLRTMPRRIEERGDLFRGALDDRQELLGPASALQEMVRRRGP